MKRSEVYPWLAAQWSNKNQKSIDSPDLKGSDVITWKCEYGHEWTTTYKSRANKNKTQCPVCSGRLPAPNESIGDLFPDLAKQFVEGGNDTSPFDIHPGSIKKYKWKCANGHTYEAGPRQLTLNKNPEFCPTCKSFGFKFPELLKEWNDQRNAYVPYEVTPFSKKKVWWKCEKGHEWDAALGSRIGLQTGCPYCSGLRLVKENSFAHKFPEQSKCWDYQLNKKGPEEVSAHTGKKFNFICEKGHRFQAVLNNIANGRWCPYCSNKKAGYENTLAARYPELQEEWNYEMNNKTPKDYTWGSNKKVWWRCKEGHEWKATIASRTAGTNCGVCANRQVGYGNSLADQFPELLKEWDYDKNSVSPSEVYAKSSHQVWWRCPRGHSWKTPVLRRTSEMRGCPLCTSQTSLPEIRLFAEFSHLFHDVQQRTKVEGMEVDVLIPRPKIAIEYDGYYYHKDKAQADAKKRRVISAAGYLFIRFREEPLMCGELDLPVRPKHESIGHSHIEAALKLIAKAFENTQIICSEYSRHDGFVAEDEYRRIVSFLPGPPEENSLAEARPDLALEWNLERNSPLTPDQFHIRSGKKVWWRCEKGHEWEATIDKRSSGRGCPFCGNKKLGYGNSLAEMYPEIAKLWYQPGNGDLTPADVRAGSNTRAWWICENGHISATRVVDKVRRQGSCLYCPGVGKNRKYTAPDFSKNP